MEWWLAGTLMFCGLLILISLGVHVGFALFATALVSATFLWGTPGWLTLAANCISSLDNFLLLAAPVFIYMGICVENSGLANDALTAIEGWFAGLRGNLAMVTVVVQTIFGGATGFSSTGIAAFGPVMLPEMSRRSYDSSFAIGIVGGSSALAVLIPPSVPLLLYGFLSGTSVSKLFSAGLVPGIVASVMFIVYIAIRVRRNPGLAPVGEKVTLGKKISNTWHILPLLILMGSVLGSLWGGIATPTEAAALGSLVALLMVVAYKRFNWSFFISGLVRTAQISASVFLIVIGAFAFTQSLSYVGFITNFSSWVIGLGAAPGIIVIVMMLANIFLGCFFDTTAILFLTIPMYAPIIRSLGLDPIWFGVLIVINSEIGCLTPPVGMNLFMLKAVVPLEIEFNSIIKGVAPFWFLYLGLMAVVGLLPQIALWLPGKLG